MNTTWKVQRQQRDMGVVEFAGKFRIKARSSATQTIGLIA